MSMRKQLYEWNINRQVNGFPLTDPGQGTTFEQIAGIPFSIFTGGIGNNITMPAATTATQFVTIDSVRGSPSYFLSGAAVQAAYNTLAGSFRVTGGGSRDVTAGTNLGAGFTINTSGTFSAALPTPTSNTGGGSQAVFTIRATGAASPNPTAALDALGGSGYAVGDVLSWDAAAVEGADAAITGSTGAALTYTVQASDIGQMTVIPATTPAPTGVTTYTPDIAAGIPELTFQTTHINPGTSIAGPLMFMQVVINTTSYFDETDGTVGPGLPGSSSPYPESSSIRASFDFETPVYILPGQQWDVQVTVYNDSRSIIGNSAITYNYIESGQGITHTEDLRCLVQYTLYDGPDALIATKLVEMGVAVRPENVDWYKRQLLEGTI